MQKVPTTTTQINGMEYELSTKLVVAYKVQGCNNHKPYTEVFQNLGDMPLEKQIEILYVAFQVANPEVAKSMPFMSFLSYYLENYKLKQVMDQLQGVVKGVLGEEDPAPATQDTADNLGDVGNELTSPTLML